MKYYSEKTKKLYETEDELKKAEVHLTEIEALKEEKIKKIEEVSSDIAKKRNELFKLLEEYTKQYGVFKSNNKDVSKALSNDNDLFDFLRHCLLF